MPSALPCPPLPRWRRTAGCGSSSGWENRLEISRNDRLSVPATGTGVSNVTRLSFGLTSEREIDQLEFLASGALIAENGTDGPGSEFTFGREALDLTYHREKVRCSTLAQATATMMSTNSTTIWRVSTKPAPGPIPG